MAKAKKKKASRPASPASLARSPSLPPQVLEEAAQGWLQSSRAPTAPRPAQPTSDHRLSEALMETLRQLRAEISELRTRIEKLETR